MLEPDGAHLRSGLQCAHPNFAVCFLVHIPWEEMVRGLFIPTLSATTTFWTSVVAILGTTISPYLFFWQAWHEVEEVEAARTRDPLKFAPHQAEGALQRIRLDTYIGMAFSNLVAIAIIVTTAATLHVHGVTNIQTSSQAAEALRPVPDDLPSVSSDWVFWARVSRFPSSPAQPPTLSVKRGSGRPD